MLFRYFFFRCGGVSRGGWVVFRNTFETSVIPIHKYFAPRWPFSIFLSNRQLVLGTPDWNGILSSSSKKPKPWRIHRRPDSHLHNTNKPVAFTIAFFPHPSVVCVSFYCGLYSFSSLTPTLSLFTLSHSVSLSHTLALCVLFVFRQNYHEEFFTFSLPSSSSYEIFISGYPAEFLIKINYCRIPVRCSLDCW